jgi:hypothetical protein
MTDSSEAHRHNKVEMRWFRNALVFLACVGGLSFSAASLYLLVWSFYNETLWVDIVRAHPAAVVGLPLAALVAFILVVLLEQSRGPIEFEGIGLKLKGAAGPLLMWVICFLAVATAIKLLW